MNEVSDYLVIGGGTAGCIVAARLSENPAIRVTLLEAGPRDRDPWIHIPAGYARLFASGKYDWKFSTEAEAELGGRQVNWPRGKVLGGSGSINGLVFLRGSPHDYDRWAQAGARGWAYADVLPAFRRLEDWRGSPSAVRGQGGPVPVSEPRSMCEGAAAFMAACEAAGFRRHTDINADAIEGVAPMQLNVRRGRRVSTAQGYLRPARRRENLQVHTGITVSRVLIEAGRAVGCEARREGSSETQTFRTAREVILCAGAVVSPKLLMLSGIGNGAALQELGLPVEVDRTGVGQNLQDHFISRFSYRTRPAGTMNERAGTLLRQAWMAMGYALHRRGPMAVGACEATLFAKVTPGAEEAEIQYQFVNFSLAPGKGYTLADHPGVMFNFGQCRPDSRGSIMLRSPDAAAAPVIRANYLSAASDRHVMLEGARLGRQIGRTAPFSELVEEELMPPGLEDDGAMLEHIRANGTTVYHPCGTCRMGADAGAVVDPRLQVRGVDGLRVVDASVFPLIPSSNIQPAVMMVAERGAEMIRVDGQAA